jgi:hypothetical protein
MTRKTKYAELAKGERKSEVLHQHRGCRKCESRREEVNF